MHSLDELSRCLAGEAGCPVFLAIKATIGTGDESLLDEQREGAAECWEDEAWVRAVWADVYERVEERRDVGAAGLGGFGELAEDVALICEGCRGTRGSADFEGDKGFEPADCREMG